MKEDNPDPRGEASIWNVAYESSKSILALNSTLSAAIRALINGYGYVDKSWGERYEEMRAQGIHMDFPPRQYWVQASEWKAARLLFEQSGLITPELDERLRALESGKRHAVDPGQTDQEMMDMLSEPTSNIRVCGVNSGRPNSPDREIRSEALRKRYLEDIQPEQAPGDDIGVVKAKMSALKAILEKSINERELLDAVSETLGDLRREYRDHKTDFLSDVVSYLKAISSLEGTLREFIDALEDSEGVRTSDEAIDLATTFRDLAQRMQPYPIAGRAEKEMRQMVQRSKQLPVAAEVTAETDLQRRIARLQSKARLCHKCNKPMTVREGGGGLFWGCSTFPACFGRAWLSKADKEILSKGL